MSYHDKYNYSFSFELHSSVITDTLEVNRDFVINLINLKLYKCLGYTGSDQQIIHTTAELFLNDVTLHGDEPAYPSRIIDFSLVRDGEIFGNLLNYPFVINGDIQFVVTLESYIKLTIRARKMYMILSEPAVNYENIQ